MSNELTRRDVCKILKISEHTFKKWYVVERLRHLDNPDTEYRLPVPKYHEHQKGKPMYFLESDIEKFKEFRNYIGEYGKYTNPNYYAKKGERNNE
jgi:hypothetical protein